MLGFFQCPEDVGINVEYFNPSFLVKKSNGGFRLVTAFAGVGRYNKPQPSLMADADSVLRQLASWRGSKGFEYIPNVLWGCLALKLLSKSL